MGGTFAILVDGGFMKKKLERKHKRFPTVADVQADIDRIKKHPLLRAHSLLRVYFYDAPPATGKIKNPIDQIEIDLSKSAHYSSNISLQQSLEMQPDFALRSGDTIVHGWSVGECALKQMLKKPRPLEAKDLVPNIEQKGVDLRIGLDIARLSLRSLVNIIVVVTGDSDIVPAFKFARREGVRVYLDHMNHSVKRELKAHVDAIL